MVGGIAFFGTQSTSWSYINGVMVGTTTYTPPTTNLPAGVTVNWGGTSGASAANGSQTGAIAAPGGSITPGQGGTGGTAPPPTAINTAQALAFTGSTYGISIPILFGSDRLAGNVIWSGAPRIVTELVGAQTYAFRRINFALALCEGEVNNILRMWIGERLVIDNSASIDENGIVVPNASGATITHSLDLTAEGSPLRVLSADARATKITFYNGSETQTPPIAMTDVEAGAPGYRGTAYVFFEDFLIDEGTLPNIYVEVMANADRLIPRSYGVPATPQVVFDDVNNNGLFYDPSYGRIFAGAFDSSGSGPIPDGEGWLVLNNATLEEVTQLEFTKSTGLTLTTGINTANAALLTSGHMLVGQTDGNQGLLHTFNTTTGRIDATLGPGGSLTGHDADGFAALGIGSLAFFARGNQAEPMDIFCGLGATNRSLGFAQIDTNNQITFLSTLNQVFASGRASARGVAYQLAPSAVVSNPTWMNGTTPTNGTNIIFVSGASTERTEFDVGVVCYDNAPAGASPTSPVFVSLGVISCADIGGLGEPHTISQMFIDPRDNMLVVVFASTGARKDRIIKFNPFTGAVVWSTAVDHFSPATTAPWSIQTASPAGVYCWISQSPDAVWKIDLATGRVTLIDDDLAAQALDIPGSRANQQIYNGFENSITYFGSTGTKLVTKIYIDRLARGDVLVSDIVESLLTRIGLDPTQRDVEDLTALSLTGYTVKNVTTLRDIFTELATVYRFDIIESEGTIKYKTRGNAAVATIPAKYLADVDSNGWFKEAQDSDFTRRRKINLIYRDVEREYANNVQSYALPRYTSEKFEADASIDVTVPIVLDATDAKALAEILLYSKIVYETTYTFKLPQRYLALEPGDVVDIALSDTKTVTCRLDDVNVGSDNTLELTASREDNDIYTDIVSLAGDVGRFEASGLLEFDPRYEIHYVQVPYLAASDVEDAGTQYAYHFFILNPDTAVVYTNDVIVRVDGEPVTLSMPIGYPTWGYVVTPLPDTTSWWSTDRHTTMRVHLVGTSGHIIGSAANKATLTGNSHINLALVGNELIQFQTATLVSDSVYDLTGIVRAKFGTDGAVNDHTAGEKFILLGSTTGERETNYCVFLTALGDRREKGLQVFLDTNNPFQPAPQKIVTALNMTPLAPADAKAEYVGDDAVVTWQRRTHFDGEWADDLVEDVPFLEADERYTVYFFRDLATFSYTDALTYLRKVEVTTNTYTYAVADQVADGFDNLNDDVYILIYQTGSRTGQDTGAATVFRLEYKR